MRKGPITIDSLDRPNAPNPNIPRQHGVDSNMPKYMLIAAGLIFLFWVSGLIYSNSMCEYDPCRQRDIVFWLPFAIIGLVTIIGGIYWIRKILIFDGIENNTSILGLNKNKEMIAAAIAEYAKASATAYHQNVTYGDNTNNTTATSTNLSNDTPAGDNTFIPMSALLDQLNKK